MKKEIFIKTTIGDILGVADVVGGLAIHREADMHNKCFCDISWWQITHVPSGLKIPKADNFPRKQDAIFVRKQLLKLGNLATWITAAHVPIGVKKATKKLQPKWEKFKE